MRIVAERPGATRVSSECGAVALGTTVNLPRHTLSISARAGLRSRGDVGVGCLQASGTFFLVCGPTEPRGASLGVLAMYWNQAFLEGGRRTSGEPQTNLRRTSGEPRTYGGRAMALGRALGALGMRRAEIAQHSTQPPFSTCDSCASLNSAAAQRVTR
jgi:hypothetical protein